MNYFKFAIFAAVFTLTACSQGDVPSVEDPHNIVMDGKKITQQEFLQKYCVSNPANETCAKVRNAMSLDSTKGQMPKGW
jgi:hypothetical protein